MMAARGGDGGGIGGVGTAEKRQITTVELQAHNLRSDLWISMQGKVYDVTRWLDSHPGGDLPLLHLAGQDATDAFLAYHPPSAYPHLARFCIGCLSDPPPLSPVSADYRALLSHFTSLGLFDRKGPTVPSLLCLIAALLALVVHLVVFRRSPFAHVLAGAVLGFAWIQSGWIGHDSGHHGVMPTKGLTRFVQVLTGNCLGGICIAWWKRNHNAHHIACNSIDHDPDLQYVPLFAVHSRFFHSIWSRFYHRPLEFTPVARFLVGIQHWTFYPVMAVARINLFAQSIILLISTQRVPSRAQEIAGVAVFWVWYPLLISFLPSWWERAAFVLASFAAVGVQHVQFCLNHFSSAVYEGPPVGKEWVERQTAGTLNIECSPWMDWFHGGLQFQVEHHLFPRMPRCHYRAIAPIVREMCRKHGVKYSTASFWEANVRIVRTLRAAAVQARKAAVAPRNLVWEAVNTHG